MKKVKYTRKRKSKNLNVLWFTIFLIIFITSTSTAYSLYNSKGIIKGNIDAKTDYHYYFELPTEWIGNNVYAYAWDSTSEDAQHSASVYNANFPGVELIKVNSEKNIYCYTITREDVNFGKYDKIIFSTDRHDVNRTVDLTISSTMNNYIFNVEKLDMSGKKRIFIKEDYWNPVYVYLWNSNGESEKEWNGNPMTRVADKTYGHIFDEKYTNVVFNNGGRDQTGDLGIPIENDMTYDRTSNTWRKYYYDGKWSPYHNKKGEIENN